MGKEIKKLTSLKMEEGSDLIWVVAATEDVDRVGDIMKVDSHSVVLENFKKNPIILFNHNPNQIIGKAEKIEIQDGKLLLGIKFAETPEAQKVAQLVKGGYLNTASIGFRVLECYGDWCDRDFEKLEKDYPDFFKRIKDRLFKADRVVTKWELYEVSIVAVPANPNALVVLKSCGLSECFLISPEGKLMPFDLSNIEVKKVIPYRSHGKLDCIDDKTAWSKQKAIATLRKWASSDCSGDKDKIDWGKYKKGFAYVKDGMEKNLTAYKFPHHIADCEKGLCVHRRGVIVAMAFLFKPNVAEAYSEEDRKGIYNHLAKHYEEDLGKTPPKFKSEGGYSLKEAFEAYKAGELDKETLDAFLEVYPLDVEGEKVDEKALKELKEFVMQIFEEKALPTSSNQTQTQNQNQKDQQLSKEEIKKLLEEIF